jgi:hypothetical protein
MNPADPNLPQANPASQPPQPASPAGDVPVFHNPLAQGYENGTAQLPPIQPDLVQPAAPLQTNSVASNQPPASPAHSIVDPPSDIGMESAATSPPQPVVGVGQAQPRVSELSDTSIKPAPVRLAPVPRSDDMHAGGLQDSSQSTPFGSVSTTNVAPAPSTNQTSPQANVAKRKPIGFIVGIAVGVAALLVAGIGGYAFFMSKKSKQPVVSSSVTVGSVRDKTEKPTQPFSEKISTDCYIAQALTPVETQQNKDCALSITYGEQKVSSIFVSALGQFDLTTGGQTDNNSQNTNNHTDTKKYLEALIVDIIPKDLVTTREDIKVGGLDATKVVGKKDAASSVDVAYVFIILPDGDKTFGDKTFVAFIVTGAYNDDYSRKGFDQFLSTWSWK